MNRCPDPVEAITATMARYYEAGAPVISDVVSKPNHHSAAVIGLPGAPKFFDDRFAGLAPLRAADTNPMTSLIPHHREQGVS